MSFSFRITARNVVAGGVIEDGHCMRAAPIIKYMAGWTVKQIEKHCRRKKWKYHRMPGNEARGKVAEL